MTSKFYYRARNIVGEAVHHLLDTGTDPHGVDQQFKLLLQ
jgi:hypothetical protein